MTPPVAAIPPPRTRDRPAGRRRASRSSRLRDRGRAVRTRAEERRRHLLARPRCCSRSRSYVAIGAAVLWAARQTGDARRALGLVAPRSWPRAVGLALLTVIAALVVSAALEPIFHGARQQGLAPDSPRPPGFSPVVGVVLACVAVAVVGPLVEELFFRGLLTAAFRRRFGPLAHRAAHGGVLRARALHPARHAGGLPARARARVRVRAHRQHDPGDAGSLPVQRNCPDRGPDPPLTAPPAARARCSTLPPRERAGQRSVGPGGSRAHLGARRASSSRCSTSASSWCASCTPTSAPRAIRWSIRRARQRLLDALVAIESRADERRGAARAVGRACSRC